MKVSVRQVDQVSVLDLSGRITIGEGDIVLKEKFRELIDGGHCRILLNLEAVSYLDSSGIGALSTGYKRAKELGGDLKLLNPSPRIDDLLHVTRLNEVLVTFRDETEALDSFR